MRQTNAFALLLFLGLAPAARGADPLTVELPAQAAARTTVVAVGDIARVTGGDAAAREWVAKLDIAEFRTREESLAVSPRTVEYRLRLAGVDPVAVRVTGAERTTVVLTRRAVTSDEILAAARAELLRRLPAGQTGSVELALPIVVKLPEVPAGESVTITAQPHGRVSSSGRVQMDVAIASGGEQLLSLAAYLEVRPTANLAEPVTATAAQLPAAPPPPPATVPAAPPAADVVIRPRQRVTMQVKLGGAVVTAAGEAQQEGRLGQSILVQNVDSKKVITGRVSGPGTVDVELGGGP